MSLTQLLSALRRDPNFMMNVMAWRTLPAMAAQYATVPAALHPALQQALHQRQIAALYSHQAETVNQVWAGNHVVVVTPTASGKTLCYNLPVLDLLLRDATGRALYLFPTKALAHDQLHELRAWEADVDSPTSIRSATYDGDTPSSARAGIRKQSRLILSNPDMLHTGILPYHTAWEPFFTGLRYVILDEVHTYRGVFGSHVANVLRRLQRICHLYGSHPHFICTSATIANPQQFVERLIEQPVTVIDQNGAPRGEKQVILYNPPLYDPERGLRRSAVLDTQELATRALRANLQTIVFGRSRLTTEILLTYLREMEDGRRETGDGRQETGDGRRETGDRRQETGDGRQETGDGRRETGDRRRETGDGRQATRIRGYRGGYLPNERRAIETGLRDGTVQGVVATNALELGIDIGGLQAAVLCGYPGTIASTWQQMGRAGRTEEGALAILVATGGLLDQYILQHPDYIFERSPEHALINPDNLLLLVDHLRCAAFEVPFAVGESFGRCPFTEDALQLLVEQGEVQFHGGRYFWRGPSYPARQFSLRSAGGDTVAIQVESFVEPTESITDNQARLRQARLRQAQPALGETSGAPDDVDFYGEGAASEEPATRIETVRVIGQIDRGSAPLFLHDGAIYLHEGQSYHVKTLDLETHQATVAPTKVDFYTEVTTETEINVLAVQQERSVTGATVTHGDLLVQSQVVGYRRVKRFTHETLGTFPLEYPPQQLETSGYWFSLLPIVQQQLAEQGQWFDSVNDYGPNWQAQRQRVRARDNYRCTQCGRPEAPTRQHDVHHLVPFRTFGYLPGLNENYREANRLNNLVLVCRTCHRRLESGVRTRTGLDGLAYALTNLAPLHLMCDPQDLGVTVARGERRGEMGDRRQETGDTRQERGDRRYETGDRREETGEGRQERGDRRQETGDRGQETRNLREPLGRATRNSLLATIQSGLPTIYLYERVAAGLGFSAQLYGLHETLLQAAMALIQACPCQWGCPACVGPVLEGMEAQLKTKELTLALLHLLTAESATEGCIDQ